jgi:hypothetical protein
LHVINVSDGHSIFGLINEGYMITSRMKIARRALVGVAAAAGVGVAAVAWGPSLLEMVSRQNYTSGRTVEISSSEIAMLGQGPNDKVLVNGGIVRCGDYEPGQAPNVRFVIDGLGGKSGWVSTNGQVVETLCSGDKARKTAMARLTNSNGDLKQVFGS